LKKIFYFLAAVLSVYFFIFAYLYFSAVEEYSLFHGNSAHEVDALVVFFGDFDNEGGLSAESLRRLAFAVDLYQKEIGKNIIFVGGYRPSRKIHGSEVMAERAGKMGVKPDNIFHDKTSRDTLNNWEEAEKIISAKKFKRVMLISSLFHILRIEQIIKTGEDIEASYICYDEKSVYPEKNLLDSLREYNYNVISMVVYLVLPQGIFKDIIVNMRR